MFLFKFELLGSKILNLYSMIRIIREIILFIFYFLDDLSWFMFYFF